MSTKRTTSAPPPSSSSPSNNHKNDDDNNSICGLGNNIWALILDFSVTKVCHLKAFGFVNKSANHLVHRSDHLQFIFSRLWRDRFNDNIDFHYADYENPHRNGRELCGSSYGGGSRQHFESLNLLPYFSQQKPSIRQMGKVRKLRLLHYEMEHTALLNDNGYDTPKDHPFSSLGYFGMLLLWEHGPVAVWGDFPGVRVFEDGLLGMTKDVHRQAMSIAEDESHVLAALSDPIRKRLFLGFSSGKIITIQISETPDPYTYCYTTLATKHCHRNEISSLCFLPDGGGLLSASQDGTIVKYPHAVSRGSLDASRTILNVGHAVLDLAAAELGGRIFLASADRDANVMLWWEIGQDEWRYSHAKNPNSVVPTQICLWSSPQNGNNNGYCSGDVVGGSSSGGSGSSNNSEPRLYVIVGDNSGTVSTWRVEEHLELEYVGSQSNLLDGWPIEIFTVYGNLLLVGGGLYTGLCFLEDSDKLPRWIGAVPCHPGPDLYSCVIAIEKLPSLHCICTLCRDGSLHTWHFGPSVVGATKKITPSTSGETATTSLTLAKPQQAEDAVGKLRAITQTMEKTEKGAKSKTKRAAPMEPDPESHGDTLEEVMANGNASFVKGMIIRIIQAAYMHAKDKTFTEIPGLDGKNYGNIPGAFHRYSGIAACLYCAGNASPYECRMVEHHTQDLKDSFPEKLCTKLCVTTNKGKPSKKRIKPIMVTFQGWMCRNCWATNSEERRKCFLCLKWKDRKRSQDPSAKQQNSNSSINGLANNQEESQRITPDTTPPHEQDMEVTPQPPDLPTQADKQLADGEKAASTAEETTTEKVTPPESHSVPSDSAPAEELKAGSKDERGFQEEAKQHENPGKETEKPEGDKLALNHGKNHLDLLSIPERAPAEKADIMETKEQPKYSPDPHWICDHCSAQNPMSLSACRSCTDSNSQKIAEENKKSADPSNQIPGIRVDTGAGIGCEDPHLFSMGASVKLPLGGVVASEVSSSDGLNECMSCGFLHGTRLSLCEMCTKETQTSQPPASHLYRKDPPYGDDDDDTETDFDDDDWEPTNKSKKKKKKKNRPLVQKSHSNRLKKKTARERDGGLDWNTASALGKETIGNSKGDTVFIPSGKNQKRRGRPPSSQKKQKAESVSALSTLENKNAKQTGTAEVPIKKKRGRPRKNPLEPPGSSASVKSERAPKRSIIRGRKKPKVLALSDSIGSCGVPESGDLDEWLPEGQTAEGKTGSEYLFPDKTRKRRPKKPKPFPNPDLTSYYSKFDEIMGYGDEEDRDQDFLVAMPDSDLQRRVDVWDPNWPQQVDAKPAAENPPKKRKRGRPRKSDTPVQRVSLGLMTSTAAPSIKNKVALSEPPKPWKCSKCTFVNEPGALSCSMCHHRSRAKVVAR